MFFRTGFNYDRDMASVETGVSCPESESVVQQSFAEEVDINTIVRRFGLTGEVPQNVRMPIDADFVAVTDFHSAMNAVRAAEEEFGRLPASVRERFGHDPGKLIAFMEDAGNREEAVKLGLVVPPVVEADKAVASADKAQA